MTTAYVAYRGGSPVASIVTVTERFASLTKAYLADVLPAGYRNPDRKGAIAALIEAILTDQRDVDLFSAFGSSLPTDILRSFGFLPNDRFPMRPVSTPVRLATRPLDDDLSGAWTLNGVSLTDPQAWGLSIGTMDLA
ncbi:MAG: hypothetical protein ABEI77_08620 [Halorientalis sp.]